MTPPAIHINMPMDNMQETVGTVVTAGASVAWLPYQFGYDMLSYAGETGAVMLATVIAFVALYSALYKFDILE